jgi:uncharacterized membrane protein YidH (DUF202 family)
VNRWVRIGLAILVLAMLARFGLAIFALGLRVALALFPFVILVGAGLVLYGLYRHWKRRAALRERDYFKMLDD